jgi:hypothetical protein
MLAINGRISSVIGFSPFFATYSYNIKLIKTEESLKIKNITLIAKKKSVYIQIKKYNKNGPNNNNNCPKKYETYSNMHR